MHFDVGTVSKEKELPQCLHDGHEWHIHRRYIIFNNPQSTFTVHILLNKREYGPWTQLYYFYNPPVKVCE